MARKFHALPETDPQHHIAASLEHRVVDAVQRGRKVWEPASRQAFETFTDVEGKKLIRVQHILIALEVCVSPPTAIAESFAFRTHPQSLWTLFEEAWVRARIAHDEFAGGIIWRHMPAVEVMEIPQSMQIWSLYLRLGFVPQEADRLIDDAEEERIRQAPMLAEIEGIS